MESPASIANKRLATKLTPLAATLTKNRGWGTPMDPLLSSCGTAILGCALPPATSHDPAANGKVERAFATRTDAESKANESYSHDQELSRRRHRNCPGRRQNPPRRNV